MNIPSQLTFGYNRLMSNHHIYKTQKTYDTTYASVDKFDNLDIPEDVFKPEPEPERQDQDLNSQSQLDRKFKLISLKQCLNAKKLKFKYIEQPATMGMKVSPTKPRDVKLKIKTFKPISIGPFENTN